MRLATFNIKHGAPERGEEGNPEAFVEACTALEPDVLALQEVDRGVYRSRYADFASLVARALDMQLIFAKTMRVGNGEFGNALLVRGEIDDIEVLKLPRGDLWRNRGWPRNAILATAIVGGQEISVAATHLSPPHQVNQKQLDKTARALARRPEPLVLLGDFNQDRAQMLGSPLLKSMTVIEEAPTFPASSPRRQIDHIAVKGLTPDAATTVSFPFSDHLALVADVS